MQGRAPDSDAYYSCYKSFNSHEASNSDQGGGPQDFLLKFKDQVDSSYSDEGSLEGDLDTVLQHYFFFWIHNFSGRTIRSLFFSS